jgi:hypothetical protein
MNVRSLSRKQLLMNKSPGTPFPQTSVITCWGALLDATVCCSENSKSFVLWQMNLTETILTLLQYCRKYLMTQTNLRR